MPSTSVKQAKFMRAVAHSPKFAKKVGVPQSVGKDYEMADKKKKMKKFGDGGMTKKPKMDMPREPITGGPKTVPLTPERKEFLKELEKRNKQAKDDAAKTAKKATPYAKGGAVKKKKYAEGGDAKAGERGSMASRMDRMKGRFDDKMARFKDRMADMPEARRAKMQERVDAMGDRFGAKMDRFKARMPAATPAAPAVAAPAQVAIPTTTNKPRMAVMKKGGKVMKKSDKAGRALVKKSADTMGRAMVKKNKGGSCYAGGGLVAGHKSADGIAKKGKTKGKMC